MRYYQLNYNQDEVFRVCFYCYPPSIGKRIFFNKIYFLFFNKSFFSAPKVLHAQDPPPPPPPATPSGPVQGIVSAVNAGDNSINPTIGNAHGTVTVGIVDSPPTTVKNHFNIPAPVPAPHTE